MSLEFHSFLSREAIDAEILKKRMSSVPAEFFHFSEERAERIVRYAQSARRQAKYDALSAIVRKHEDILGFPHSMLMQGFEQVFASLTSSALSDLIQRECVDEDGNYRKAYRRIGMVTASTVPPAAFRDSLLKLILPAFILLRPSGRHLVFLSEFFSVFLENDAEMATRCFFTNARDEDLRNFFECIDICSFTGGIEAQRLYESHALMSKTPFVSYGHKVSFAVHLKSTELSTEIVAKLAQDIAMWDMGGCLSPILLLTGGDADVIAQALSEQIANFEERHTPFPLSLEEKAKRGLYLRSHRKNLYGGDNATAVVVLESIDAMRQLPKVFYILPIANADEAHAIFSRFAPHCQCLGCPSAAEAEIYAAHIDAYGFNRVCLWGEMQNPGLDWIHDGIGDLAPFLFRGVSTH